MAGKYIDGELVVGWRKVLYNRNLKAYREMRAEMTSIVTFFAKQTRAAEAERDRLAALLTEIQALATQTEPELKEVA